MSNKLGIVAGGGSLPARLIEACRRERREFFVLAFKGQTEPEQIAGAPQVWLRVGAVGKALKVLRAEGVAELVVAGHFRRPSLLEFGPDGMAIRFMLEVGRAVFRDDGLHKAGVRWAERYGFRVVAPETIDTELLATEGVYGRVCPDADARHDIERGIEVAKALGRVDVGQGAIVQQGIVLAVEAVEGTDAMIERAARLRRTGPGGVLVKVKKPGQERRLDLPAIGPRTIAHAKAAGLRGIAIEAEGAIVIDREELVRAADRAGLFVVGIKVSE